MSYGGLGHDHKHKPVSRLVLLCAGATVLVLGSLFVMSGSSSPAVVYRNGSSEYVLTSADLEDPSTGISSLKGRMKYSNEMYDRMKDRTKLLEKKHGPDPPFFDRERLFTIWDWIFPAWNSPWSVERIGAPGEGGKWVTGMERIKKLKTCVVYSFGVKDESSFEAEMLDNTNCEIFGYDFSVDKFGPEVSDVSRWDKRAHFYPYMISGVDEKGASPPKRTIQSLMEENGHDFVDVIKMDIEGSEFDVLDSIIKQFRGRPLPFGQLEVELHLWDRTTLGVRQWWERLEKAGLRPFWKELNTFWFVCCSQEPLLSEVSFINIKGEHPLVSNEAYYKRIE